MSKSRHEERCGTPTGKRRWLYVCEGTLYKRYFSSKLRFLISKYCYVCMETVQLHKNNKRNPMAEHYAISYNTPRNAICFLNR